MQHDHILKTLTFELQTPSPDYLLPCCCICEFLEFDMQRIVGKPNFSDQFKKIVKRYIRVGYNLDIMRQSACLVLNPITVYSYGFPFNCTMVGQTSDSMTALT